MHPITFQIKRLHLSIVRVGKKSLAKAGAAERHPRELPIITPARFDLLRAMIVLGKVLVPPKCEPGDEPYSCKQSELPKLLGLHKSTVNKTVERLIELGVLRIVRHDRLRDRRCHYIWFTAWGRRLYHEALGILHNGRQVANRVEKFVAPYRPKSTRRRWKTHYRTSAYVDKMAAFAEAMGSPPREGAELYVFKWEDDFQNNTRHDYWVSRRPRKACSNRPRHREAVALVASNRRRLVEQKLEWDQRHERERAEAVIADLQRRLDELQAELAAAGKPPKNPVEWWDEAQRMGLFDGLGSRGSSASASAHTRVNVHAHAYAHSAPPNTG